MRGNICLCRKSANEGDIMVGLFAGGGTECHLTNDETRIEIPALILAFNVREDEQFIPGHRTGLFLAIHSPYEGYNPTEKGIFMKPGKTYKLYVTT
ncbi:hypothetical protein AVEN_200439-1, partial [Araneus ventricosus]